MEQEGREERGRNGWMAASYILEIEMSLKEGEESTASEKESVEKASYGSLGIGRGWRTPWRVCRKSGYNLHSVSLA